MMDYKEMAAIVKARVREENERRRIRALRIKRISLAVSGICAVAIVGMGIWSNNDIKDSIPKNDTIIIEETVVSTTSITSVSDTSISTTKNTTHTTAQKTTETTAVQTQQTVTSKIRTTAVTTTVNTSVQTTIAEETTDKPFELVTFKSGTVKPYHAPINNMTKDMPTVILDGREVKHKNVNKYDDMEICFRVGVMDFGLERFTYAGKYDSICDEFGLDSYESGTATKYKYDIDTDTVYSVDITYYKIPNYLGEYAYAVKFPNSDALYLYFFYKDLYYDNEKNEYVEVKDADEFDENTEFIVLEHEDIEFFKYFKTVEYGNENMIFSGKYCNSSDISEENFTGYKFFVNFLKTENKVYSSEYCKVYQFDELEDAIVVRFGYDDVCYLYRLI